MIDTTINELKTTIGEIRDTINEGIQNRSDLTEDDKLKDDAPLVDYIDAITKLQSSITSTDQQIIVLYTYAKDKAAADSKHKPTISWAENENKEYNIEYGEFDPFGWVPTEPSRPQDITEKLWIRFASIIKGDTEATFGIPIQMTGDQGPKGDQGIPGTDAVILTAVHRLVKLYCISDTEPTIPAFRKDTSSNSKFKNDLDVTRICYGDETKPTYIAADTGVWRSKYTRNTNEVVWEIDVDINSKNDVVNIISAPVRKNITVTVTEVTYATSDNEHTPPTDGWDVRENVTLNENNPYLWSKTTTTYSDGFVQDTYLIINEVPTTITGIEIKYIGTSDFIKPREDDSWVEEVPTNSPVVWKKETTTYSNNIYSGEKTKTTIVPIVKQGPAGVQFIGHVDSSDELKSLSYTDEFIGKIAMLVGANTYIWYGTENPNLTNCQLYNGQYWLNMGPIHVCDWNAKEGELGYIKNRTHYVDKQYFSNNSPTTYLDDKKIIIQVGASKVESATIQFTNGQLNMLVCGDNVVTCDEQQYIIKLTEEGIISGDIEKIDSVTNISCFLESYYGSLENFTRFQLTPNTPNSLPSLLMLKLSNNLISGMEYKFFYDNASYVVKAISPSVLEMWCKSESKEIKVDWSNSDIVITNAAQPESYKISYLSASNINPNLKMIINSRGNSICYFANGNLYSDMFLTDKVDAAVTLKVIVYRDINCNEYQNPGCTFTNSSNNIVHGNGVVTCTNSNNNTIKMSSGSINITSSSNNIICGLGSSNTINIGGCNWCYILASTNCSNKSGAIINYTHNGSVVATGISVSGNIDVAGKVEAAGGFFKQ